MSETQSDKMAALKAKAAELAKRAELSDAAGALANVERQAAGIVRQANTLREGGYGAAGELEKIAGGVGAVVEKLKVAANTLLTAYRGALGDEVAALNEALGRVAAADEAAMAGLEASMSALDAQAKQAESALENLVEPASKALNALERHLSQMALGAEAWAEFSGDRAAGESVVIGAEAEWVAGKGRDEAPDGILYLTNGRLIFEQKEKVGKTLGFFGGKKVQEVEWALNLAEIGAVSAKNAGMLGGRDMLYFEHGGQQYTLEVKGRAVNDDWASYIERAKGGAFVIAPLDVAVPDQAEQAETLSRIERERVERRNARMAQQAANDARAAQERAKAQAAQLKVGSMGVMAAGLFGKKDAADDKPDAEAKLGGLASALRKASADEPGDKDKGGEKGQQASGAMGAMAASAAGLFGKKEAADDTPDSESKLGGLAGALKKEAASEPPSTGEEKGQQSGGPKGGNAGREPG